MLKDFFAERHPQIVGTRREFGWHQIFSMLSARRPVIRKLFIPLYLPIHRIRSRLPA